MGLKLRLDEVMTAKVIDEEKTKVFDAFLAPIKKKNRCTPEEGLEAEAILLSFESAQFKINTVREQLAPLKYYWELKHLSLKIVSHSGNLQKSENFYLQIKQVKWLETRSAGRGYQQLEQVNYGTLYLTNKRLVFEGNAKNSIIPLDRIRGIAVQSNGIAVQKDKGEDPVLVFLGDRLAFELILKRLLNG
ncbi:CheF family chemotaxis protein [Mucilaginibacter sp. BJC16-A38]|uniref:CheF family chemotaxis protein n=1 Tax=Mucilaginibacter phenanthrenivorans TaxID=1234842 RepID=UPI002158793D|nr:CheF family chemotaxis protein [Mucilaginibacter phenanthrenivorans]MCR8560414.1 CheF family chemotaxis protein [Mucilaginibacter phenanthrenivorans]